jgi:hypothetical protein
MECAAASAALRRLLDAQAHMCHSVHSWRTTAERMAAAVVGGDSRRGGAAVDIFSGINSSRAE